MIITINHKRYLLNNSKISLYDSNCLLGKQTSSLFTAGDDLKLKGLDLVKIAEELRKHEAFVKHVVLSQNNA